MRLQAVRLSELQAGCAPRYTTPDGEVYHGIGSDSNGKGIFVDSSGKECKIFVDGEPVKSLVTILFGLPLGKLD